MFSLMLVLSWASWGNSILPTHRKGTDSKMDQQWIIAVSVRPRQLLAFPNQCQQRSQDKVTSVDERKENRCVIKELMSLCRLFLVLFYFPVVAQTAPKWQYWVSLESAATLWKLSNILLGFPLYFCSKALNLICCVYKAEPCWDCEQCWFWNLQK